MHTEHDDHEEPDSKTHISDHPIDETNPISMHNRFRAALNALISDPSSSIVAKVYFGVVALLIVSTVVIMILESYMEISHLILTILEGTITGLLTLELFVRFYASVSTLKDAFYFFTSPTNIADALSCLPFYILVAINDEESPLEALRVLRLLRLFRILKVSRRMKTLILAFKKSSTVIFSILLYMFVAVLVFATIEYYAERGSFDATNKIWRRPDGSPSPFSSIPASMWWSILTLLAVGYGDVVPISPIGKFFAAMTMVVGVLVIAMPSMILGKTYTEILATQEDEDDSGLKMDIRTIMDRQVRMMELLHDMAERQEKMLREITENRKQIQELKES
jgi:voltage-gated potassium channel Kch